MGLTKDESFMVHLYEEASKHPEILDAVFDRYTIGQLTGLQKRAVDTICTLLGQANFIKKRGESEISITPQGLRLIEQIKEGK
jgi:hypothetical protein